MLIPFDVQDDDDDLHVHVSGETEEAVEQACKLVAELLVPVEDDKNEHKMKQLKELALINGTLREDDYCQVSPLDIWTKLHTSIHISLSGHLHHHPTSLTNS